MYYMHVKSQNIIFEYNEVTPRWMEKVEICKVQIFQDLEECIRHTMRNTRCNIVKRDSGEIFELYTLGKDYDACFERCTLKLYLMDVEAIVWDFQHLAWGYGGYFDIDGDRFYILGGKRKAMGEENCCFCRYLESRYFSLTRECIEMEVPVVRGMYLVNEEGNEDDNGKHLRRDYIHKDDMWPVIEIIVERGRVVSCEFNCDYYLDVEGIIFLQNRIKQDKENDKK